MQKKTKSLKLFELKEQNNKRKIITETNNKMKNNITRNGKSNMINLSGKSSNDIIQNYYTNTYKNLKIKEKMMKILSKNKTSKIKDKNGKILFLDKIQNNSNKENISFFSNLNIKNKKKDIEKDDNIKKNGNFSMKNYINQNQNKKNASSRTTSFHNNCITEKLKRLDNSNSNALDNELSRNEESFFNINGKRQKGTISFNNFIKNNIHNFENKTENNLYNLDNNLKERKSSFFTKKRLCLDNEENFAYPRKNILETNNNSIFCYYRNNKVNKNINQNKFITSIDNDKPIQKNSLRFFGIFGGNQKNNIILKKKDLKDNIEKEIKNEITNNESEKNEEKNKNKSEKKKNKTYLKKNDIYDEILDEVKQEKNYVQKIVHMKLIQGMQLLKQNSHRQFNFRYNSKTFENPKINKERNINKNEKTINEKTDDNIIDINSTLLSNRIEQNLNYIKISNSCKSFDDNNCVKIKKIKLDKLKNKLRRGSFNYCQRNNNKNININLSLNNKIININNNQKIYEPKKPSTKKKKSIEISSIPFCYPNSNKNKPKVNITSPIKSITPILYKKPSDENNKNTNRTSFHSVRSFNELSVNDLNKIEANNKIIINTNADNNENYLINNQPNIKYILYNKVRIKKDSNQISHKYLKNGRFKTIRYIKNNKNKLKRIEDSLEKENENNNKTNQIMKTQEIQFGILNKNNSRKSINNLEKTEPINFNLNVPIHRYNKQNNSINYKTFLSHDINDLTDIPNFDISKKNILNMSQFDSNNDEEMSIKTGTCKIANNNNNNSNYDYEKISNNDIDIGNDNMKFNYLKEELKGDQPIYNLLHFEDLLIIEDKLNLILIVLEKGNKSFEEYYDFINYFFSSNIKSKLEQIFKYFKKETEIMQVFVNYSLVFVLICYDFAQNSININIDNNYNLFEIFQLIYTNILLVINSIKNKIEYENKDNYKIRLIELSKIGYLIKEKSLKTDNDNYLIKEILYNNTNSITQKINNIINDRRLSDNKYFNDIFQDIQNNTFNKLYNFFLDNILKETFIGCSVLAHSYLKQKNNFVPAREPYLRGKNKKKYTIVLDLDETLIHFKLNKNIEGEGILKLRPGVFTFLEKISEFYEIILFAEASEAYIKLMMEAFNNNKKNKKYFDFILYRQYTIIEGNEFVKDLNRLGRPLNRTIIIDNIQKNFLKQKNNGILIKPFLGEDKNDTALIDLIPILINIAKDDIDVRNGLMKYRDEILTKISSNLFRRGKK